MSSAKIYSAYKTVASQQYIWQWDRINCQSTIFMPLHCRSFRFLVLQLREEGFIEKRRKDWWDEKSQCSREPPASATVTLELKNLGGVFIIMTAGIVTSFLLLGIEIKFKWIIDLILKAQVKQIVKLKSVLYKLKYWDIHKLLTIYDERFMTYNVKSKFDCTFTKNNENQDC